ncbi:MAG: lysophospholipid acyltransferase family protein [Ignavibacteriae bacterium]|nr:lysophospholipid acyltransferase family protein [Ignavibacteriota bacterium]
MRTVTDSHPPMAFTRSMLKQFGLAILEIPISWLISIVRMVFCRLSEVQAYSVARFLFTPLLSFRNGTLLRNMKKVLMPNGWTEEQVKKLVSKHNRYFCSIVVELARLPLLSNEELQARIIVKGEEHLRAAFHQGKGVLLIGTHVGNWWYTRSIISVLGYRVSNISNKVPIRSVESHLNRTRKRFHITTCYVGHGGRKAAAEALRRNEIVSLFFDVAVSGRKQYSRWLPFGPVALQVDLGPAMLALEHRVPVIWYNIHKTRGTDYDLTFEPIDIHLTEQDTEQLTRSWMDRLVKELLHSPEQWWQWGNVELREIEHIQTMPELIS